MYAKPTLKELSFDLAQCCCSPCETQSPPPPNPLDPVFGFLFPHLLPPCTLNLSC
jgi:hypothetical protein